MSAAPTAPRSLRRQVIIVGTGFGAVTDPRGHYFINNIPAGPATIRAHFVGYRPLEVRDLRVPAGG
jgi:hypothetical protein